MDSSKLSIRTVGRRKAVKNIMGAVKGTGVLWVTGLKRDPHALLELLKLFLGHNISIPDPVLRHSGHRLLKQPTFR